MDTERNSECRAPKRPVRGRRMFTAQHNISAWTEKGVQLWHGARRQQLSCKGCFFFPPLSGIFPHAGRCNRWRQLLCKLNMTNHFCETLGGATDNSGPPTGHAALRLDGGDPNTPIINCCSLSSQLELAKNIHAGWDFFYFVIFIIFIEFFWGGLACVRHGFCHFAANVGLHGGAEWFGGKLVSLSGFVIFYLTYDPRYSNSLWLLHC